MCKGEKEGGEGRFKSGVGQGANLRVGFSCKVMGHDFTQYDFEDGVGNLGGWEGRQRYQRIFEEGGGMLGMGKGDGRILVKGAGGEERVKWD